MLTLITYLPDIATPEVEDDDQDGPVAAPPGKSKRKVKTSTKKAALGESML